VKHAEAKQSKIKLTIVAFVHTPVDKFRHLRAVVDCITWRNDFQQWECSKADLLVELTQFILQRATKNQKVVFKWLESLVTRIPKRVEYIVFCQDNQKPCETETDSSPERRFYSCLLDSPE
jgi:hypothetical protein